MSINLRTSLVGICFVFLFLTANAQHTDRVIDSLQRLLNTKRISNKGKVDVLNELGYQYWIIDSNKSVIYGVEAQKIADSLGYRSGYAKSMRVLGVAYWTLGEAKLALENLTASQEVYQQIKDEEGFSNALMNTGMVYADIGDYKKALTIYDLSIQKFTELGLKRRIATTFTKIGDVYLKTANFRKAQDYLNNALSMHRKDQYIYGMNEVHNKLAFLNIELNEFEQADYHLRKAIELGQQVNDADGFIENLIQYGKLQRLRGAYEDAESHLLEALHKAQTKNLKKYVLAAYEQLKLLKKAQGDFATSLKYYDAYIGLKDSVYTLEKAKQIAALEFDMELGDKEQEIALLKEQERTNSFIKWGLVIGTLFLILIASLLMRNQKQKRLRDQELLQKQQELLVSKEKLSETALENLNLKQAELQQQIVFKNKELTSYTLNFVQKNELLQQIYDKIAAASLGSTQQKDKILKELMREIKQHVHIDKDWEDFKLFFEEVHVDFYKTLKEKHPNLSANDLKICSLTRLNLNIKETSNILGISPESTKTARYRLRKKLKLAPEELLIDYLLRLEQR